MASPRSGPSIPGLEMSAGARLYDFRGRQERSEPMASPQPAKSIAGPAMCVAPMPFSPNGEYPDGSRQVVWADGERLFCRGWRPGNNGKPRVVLVVLPAAERPSPPGLDRLAHEYGLKDELDGAWAI